MNELQLIQKITEGIASDQRVVTGPGDDCAVLDLQIPGHYLLFKTDAVVEGVHFTRETDGEPVGRKAMNRCLSDMAAMAGKPVSALVTLGLPPGYDPDRVQQIYEGMNHVAREYHFSISGGETTTNPGGFLVSIAMIGTVARDRCLLRSGGKPGHAIFVTGELGGSLQGKHLGFHPRVEEAQWLAEHFAISSMIDISDGLAGDLRHLLNNSGAGAELLTTAIPISRAARLQARAESSAKPPLLAALTDGEDFELLFTLPSAAAVPLLDAWRERFPGVRLSCIGRLTEQPGLRLRDQDGVREFRGGGYVHFQERGEKP